MIGIKQHGATLRHRYERVRFEVRTICPLCSQIICHLNILCFSSLFSCQLIQKTVSLLSEDPWPSYLDHSILTYTFICVSLTSKSQQDALIPNMGTSGYPTVPGYFQVCIKQCNHGYIKAMTVNMF